MSVETSPGGTNYLIFVPDSYDGSTAYPLLLYLHGAQAMGTIPRLETRGLPKAVNGNSFFQDFPMIIVAPHVALPRDNDHEWDLNMVNEVMDHVTNPINYNIDPDRIFGSGISLGAKGIWDYALAYPAKMIGLVPISGSAPIDNICDLDGVAVWAFHGERDGIIEIEGGDTRKGSKTVVETMNTCSTPPYLDAQLTTLIAKSHDGWDEIYDLSSGYNIYQWLLALRKNDNTNYSPIVELGENKRFVLSSSEIQLNSFAIDPNGIIQSYNWGQQAGPGLTFVDGSPNLSLNFTQTGNYKFSLQVTDDEMNTASDTVEIEIVSSSTGPAVTDLLLLDGENDQVIGSIGNNQTVSLAEYNEDQIRELDVIPVTSNLNPGNASVRFTLNNNRNFNTQNNFQINPYYSMGGNFRDQFIPGSDATYFITATAYEDRNAITPGIAFSTMVTFSSTPLPVQLISFDGSINDGQVTLNWATSEEIGNSHFEVYEGVGNAKNLRKIGRVPKSNSEAAIKSYSYSTVVSHCENIYYQIKSVDFDGHVDYSDIINVQNDASTCKLNVFPHPVTQGFLNVTNMAPYTGSMLKVISLQGQTLREMPITSEGTGVRIDTRNLQTGMYFLQVGNLKPEKIFIINN